MAKYNALGMVETFGLVYAVEAADAMRVNDMEGNLHSSVVIASPHPEIYKIIDRYSIDKILPSGE